MGKFQMVPVWLVAVAAGLTFAACGGEEGTGSSSNGTSNGTSGSSNATSNSTSTSNGTTASNGTSNGTTATSNGTTATSNGTTSTSNGTTSTSNGTTSTSNGTTACTDMCEGGSTRCNDNGEIEACETGDDGCRDWATGACPDGFVCTTTDEGAECIEDESCTDACDEGDTRCDGDNVEDCLTGDDGCTVWDVTDECGEGTVCDDSGDVAVCAAACTDACEQGATQCNDNGELESCDEGDDGCTAWSAEACAEGTECVEADDAATCDAIECDECDEGQTRCGGDENALETCTADGDGCTDWVSVECAEGSACEVNDNGAECIEDACPNACEVDALRCNDGNIESCGGAGECPEWSVSTECVDGCDDSGDAPVCLGGCEDACEADATRCGDNGIELCADGDDGCTVWGPAEPCGDNQTCEEDDGVAACVDGCTDACELGATMCNDSNGVDICADGNDGCTVWVLSSECGDEGSCQQTDDGATCVDGCTDICEFGAARCDDNNVEICNVANNGCTQWTLNAECADDSTCEEADGIAFCNSGNLCADACQRLNACSTEMCQEPLLDEEACIVDCEADEDAFGAEGVLATSCDELNAGLCELDGVPDTCMCEGIEGSTCSELNACLGECQGDPDCNQACVDATSPDELNTFNALANCANTNCEGLEGQEFQDCVQENCNAELSECFPPEPLNCGDLNTCLVECEGDEACRNACATASSPEAIDTFNALAECANAGCGGLEGEEFQTCVQDSCGDELGACFDAPPVELTCGGLNACLGECQGDEACRNACAADASPEAIDTFNTLVECANANCDGLEGEAFQTCVDDNCADELSACFDVPPAGLTCGELNSCLNACGEDQGCRDACETDASDQGRADFGTLIACAQDNCPDFDNACIRDNCSGEFEACFGPPVVDGLTCGELNACLTDCQGDQACVDACAAESSPDTIDTFNALNQCANANCADLEGEAFQTCVDDNCADELSACFDAPPVELTCSALNACLTDCQGDQACIDACFEIASTEGAQQFDALGTCAETLCANIEGQEFQTCLQDNCGDELDACFPPVVGGLSCGELNACLSDCQGDDACRDACAADSSSETIETFNALAECANTNCADFEGEAFQTCVDDNCADELGACFDAPPAELTCSELNACLGDCEGDVECQNACTDSASEQGQDEFDALIICAQTNCPNFDNDCIQQNCADESDLCFGPPPTFCVDNCISDDDCTEDGSFCFDLGDGNSICAAGSVDDPRYTDISLENPCATADECAPEQACF